LLYLRFLLSRNFVYAFFVVVFCLLVRVGPCRAARSLNDFVCLISVSVEPLSV
jgi:hypothetical protein